MTARKVGLAPGECRRAREKTELVMVNEGFRGEGGRFSHCVTRVSQTKVVVIVGTGSQALAPQRWRTNNRYANSLGPAGRLLRWWAPSPNRPIGMKRTRGRRNTPGYWWIYALLLSTMIPSLINLVIGGAEDIAHILINRLLHRTLLVPDIEAILSGRHSKGMMLEELTRATPSAWEDPAKVLGWVISDRRLKTLLQRP